MSKNKDKLDFSSNPYFGDIGANINIDGGDNAVEELENQIIDKVTKIAENVAREMSKESLPPLPANYQMYFERLLEKEDVGSRQKIQALIDLQSSNEDRVAFFEKIVKDGFKNIKQILELVALLYKNLQVSQNVSEKYVKDIANIDNKLVFNNMVKLFLKDLYSIREKIDGELENLKSIYQDTTKIISSINENTIYDSQFGVYNKRYFLTLIDKEKELIEEFNHESTMLTLTLSKNIMNDVANKTIMLILLKSIAKLLLKTSRRSDILAYFGNGIFAMGLKNSDLQSAKKAAERLIETAKSTNIFSDGRDIVLELAIGVAKITPKKTTENIVQSSLIALNLALDEKVEFKIYPQDEIE
ncbi:diguanylate cyclase [Helicobacter sp. faydin-H20]|uniref:diguanylate cyclase n=1 Tax=Helicobacter anatolicus TaxID=2905874 RepID=UPI001E2E230E|nr:diguanylate cyclase [Helicobacter anatolicus]MCE3036288.1 diguanylate cyclase [Helicobacter anatolicus]